MKIKDSDLFKEISQVDKIDEKVTEQLSIMGTIYKEIISKLESDKICFSCKKEFEFKDLILVSATKTEKGTAAIVSICTKCFKNLKKG